MWLHMSLPISVFLARVPAEGEIAIKSYTAATLSTYVFHRACAAVQWRLHFFFHRLFKLVAADLRLLVDSAAYVSLWEGPIQWQ